MNDFSLQRKHQWILAAVALVASLAGVYIDATGFLIDSLSAVVGFAAAIMLAGPIVRSFKRQARLAAASYALEIESTILLPTIHRSQDRVSQVNALFDGGDLTDDDVTLEWLEDLEVLARVKLLSQRMTAWYLYGQLGTSTTREAFGAANIENFPASVSGPYNVLLDFFPNEFDNIEKEFPGVFEWVASYEQDPVGTVRWLQRDLAAWPQEFGKASAKVDIGWEAADSLKHGINGYLKGLGMVDSTGESRIHM